MFSDLNDIEKSLIYRCMKYAIRKNSGIGFRNNDQGHPAYAAGAAGKEGMGDSPEENEFFKLVSVLHPKFCNEGDHDLSTWQGFCEMATEANYKEKGYSNDQ